MLTHTGTNHGNGFLNTGSLDGDDGGEIGRVKQVTFAAPGSFQYLCLLHPQMVGTSSCPNAPQRRRATLRGSRSASRWVLGVPDSGVGLCHEGPDVLQAVLD